MVAGRRFHCAPSGQDDRRSFVSWRGATGHAAATAATSATATAAAAVTARRQQQRDGQPARHQADKTACNFVRQRRILIRIPASRPLSGLP